MNIHEFQAKQLLAREGVVIPDGAVASNADEARSIAEGLAKKGFKRFVLKAQVHAGGRGKGTFKSGLQGGVKVLSSIDEVFERAGQMIGQVLVTKQTGADGRLVKRLLIDGAPQIKK